MPITYRANETTIEFLVQPAPQVHPTVVTLPSRVIDPLFLHRVEGVATGALSFTGTAVGAVPGVLTATRPVLAGSDDAKEASGSVPDIGQAVNLLDAVNLHLGLRFTDLPIQQGAVISDVRVSLTLSDSSKNDAEGTWFAHDVDDSQTFTTTDGDLDGRVKTTASLAWTTNDLGNAGSRVTSPNLAALLQEVVDRPGWVPGSSVSLIYVHNSTVDKIEAVAYEHATLEEPSLYVEYRTIPQVFGIGTGSLTATGVGNGALGSVEYTPSASYGRSGVSGTNQTQAGWFLVDDAPAVFNTVFALDDGVSNWMGIYISDTLVLELWNNSVAALITGPTLTAGEWYYVAVVRSGSTWIMHWRHEDDTALTTEETATVQGTVGSTNLWVGREFALDAATTLDGRESRWRVWTSSLTSSQLRAESEAQTAAVAAWADWPLLNVSSGGNDVSGNGRGLTGTGTRTDARGPHIDIGPILGVATGALTFTGTAFGIVQPPAVTGQATGTMTFTGTASGVPRVQGVGTGTLTFTGSAGGRPRVQGAATGSLAFTGTGSGRPRVVALATGQLVFTGIGAGVPRVVANATGSLTFLGSATGVVQGPAVTGVATGTMTFSGVATGTRRISSTAVGALTFNSAVVGRVARYGAGSATAVFVGSSTGLVRVPALATGVLTFQAVASGICRVHGLAVGTLVFTGEATGQIEVLPPGHVDEAGDLASRWRSQDLEPRWSEQDLELRFTADDLSGVE